MNLFFHQAALGDFALTLPVLRGLVREHGPTTVVAPWSRGWLASRVLDGVRAMDIELFEFSRLHSDAGPSHLSPAVAELFASATRVVSFVSTGRDAWARHVRRLTPEAAMACVDPRPTDAWAGHVAEHHHASLASQGLVLPPVGTCLADLVARDGPVVVHPGSGGLAKCWPADRYEALIERLREGGREVLPVYGEVEADRWPDAQQERWRSGLGARLCRSLEELWPVLQQAGAYVGNDAGPTHVAAQLGLPVVALFGPSDPARWAPLGPRVEVVAPDQPGPIDWLGVERAADAVSRLLDR